MRKVFRITILSIFLLGIFFFPAPALAATDFDITIDRIFQASDDATRLYVTERRTVSNNTYSYYIPTSSQETFLIQNFRETLSDEEYNLKTSTLTLTDEYGNSIYYSLTRDGDNIVVTANYPTPLNSHQSQVFLLQYQTNELTENVGKITNIYIPGLEENYEETATDTQSGTTTSIGYTTRLMVPKTLGTSSFTLPQPTNSLEDDNFYTYEFGTGEILGKTVWQQIGTEQIYKFKITQPTLQTDFTTSEKLSFLSKNKYSVVLPRQYDETNQQVLFTSINPLPNEVYQDEDGNLIAVFYMDANQTANIVIEGYITVALDLDEAGNATPEPILPTNATLTDLSNYPDMSKYLQSAEYWEVDSPEIQQKAQELVGDKTKIIDILRADYEFIINSIDYDVLKTNGQNQRQGALATLQGGSSVCMEYSDLLIAITRAQGIPSRAAYGYGYDPKYSNQQLDHQWVQVWIPEFGWLSIDPTWGETGREFIGGDLDHALWYVASQNPNTPAPLEIYSSGTDSSSEIQQADVQISAEKEIPSDIELKSPSELMQEIGTDNSIFTKAARFIQVSPVGKSLIIIAPSCLVVALLVFFVSTISRLIRKIAEKRRIADQPV